ncbi:chaplin family protein [Streptomyces longwoodensis]|uniref:chaplin family protein n=1 Tax=Streptomyces longwoodensis TaxID=68231 RepID=UPI0037B25DC3
MITKSTATALGLLAASVGAGLASASPASAGGVGDFLSPAFGTSCTNQHTGAHADGITQYGTGTAGGNLAGLPVGSPLNQCGGADPLPNIYPGATKELNMLSQLQQLGQASQALDPVLGLLSPVMGVLPL